MNINDAYVEQSGIARWKSNDAVPPQECLEQLKALGLVFNMHMSQFARDIETAAFIREYRKSQASRPVSAEERFEMEAAFGKGATVVNVITGRKVRL
jgi:hypothetical protein